MLAVFCLTLGLFLRDRSFVNNEMQTWKDAMAIVEESAITKPPAITEQTDSDDNIYYEYRVDYSYTAGFDAWGGPFSFTRDEANTGKLNNRHDEIPKSAYEIPVPGTYIAVIYDPENRGTYRLGSIAEWNERAELSFKNLVLPIVFGAVAALAFYLGAFIRRREKKVISEGYEAPAGLTPEE